MTIHRGYSNQAGKTIYDKPMAAKGLTSYRYKGRYGWIMIGAVDIKDALNEAGRSTNNVTVDKLQVWVGTEYRSIKAVPTIHWHTD
jgi:hypothetical protein